MSIKQSIANRLRTEDDYKKQWIYDHCNYSLVTRFFPTGEAYPENRTYGVAKALSPTMFTPWGKILGPTAGPEQASFSQASFLRAIQSILSQILYDLANTLFYTIAAIPSLIIGAIYLAYAYSLETNEETKNNQIKFAQEKCFGNVVLAPYFAAAIVIDFLREFGALFSRSLATIMQTDEERNSLNWPISQNIQVFR